ncbi:MAG: DNRLRE domain-containing protein, partial [Candidatus Thermoplasmatota archaeon]|nr:DNRLRE domain-containing protein [Candidatus Thermoplasmatota archaeon]
NSSLGNDTANLGVSPTTESRILLSFSNSVPIGDLVTNASLFITCGADPQNLTDIKIYPSRVKKLWYEENVTWYQRYNSTAWQLQGVDGSGDRGDWEPPFYGYGNSTFQIDVTSIVQDAVINSRTTIEVLLAATNGYYSCHMSETPDSQNRPYLSIDHQNGTHTSGGSLTPNFVSDGTALMDESKFLLTAATNPDISWDAMIGNHAEVHLSHSSDFKSESDKFWYYNSVSNSSLFTMSTNSGEMTIPAGHELTNTTTMHYRIRATDANHTIGQWKTGFFHLPGHSASQNGNYGTVSFDFDDLGLSEDTFQDTFIDSSQRNSNMGSDNNFTVGTSPNSEQYGLIRINMDDVGLHSN